jgi:oligopeptidase B
MAPRRPTVRNLHGSRAVDDYAWLRDRSNPQVLDHLRAENDWAELATAPLGKLRRQLFSEITARVPERSESVPARRGPWWYLNRSFEGRQYPIHYRRRDGSASDAAVVLDENELAQGHRFFDLGAFEPSPDQRLLAFSVDCRGDGAYSLRVKDLETDEVLPGEIPEASTEAAWTNDGMHLFYTTLDHAKRPWRLYRHRIGTDPKEDLLVYAEADQRFHVSLGKSRSGAYLLVSTHSQTTSEVRILAADDPTGPLRTVEPRHAGVEYQVEHHADTLFVLTNHEARDFRVMRAPVADPRLAHWRELVAADEDVRIHRIDAFSRHLVVWYRSGGLAGIRIVPLDGGKAHEMEFPEPIYTVLPGDNWEFDTNLLRLGYSSFCTPQSTFDYDMDERRWELKRREPVLGGYDPADYEAERIWAPTPDGVRVPISLVRRSGTAVDGSAPCLLTGYGAYERSSDPSFSIERLSLLDRGFVWAVAHVRGGGELGRGWYEAGKLLAKRNTFDDFIACAEHLVATGYAAPDRLVARGESAGGLLVGTVANMRPDRFRAIVAEVPFVDVVNTMLDPVLPLTVTEVDEWGDPSEPDLYRYMMSYAPYENVGPHDYPAMLVTAGLDDPQVGYWEPVKWVAKLRVLKTDRNPLILRVDMASGHEGPSGRYDAWWEESLRLGFVLDAVGIRQ